MGNMSIQVACICRVPVQQESVILYRVDVLKSFLDLPDQYATYIQTSRPGRYIRKITTLYDTLIFLC